MSFGTVELSQRLNRDSYLVVDTQDGYVREVHTPANQGEMMHFEAIIEGANIERNRVNTAKGSGSQRQSAVS